MSEHTDNLKRAIAETEEKVKPLVSHLSHLRANLRAALAAEFIAVNGITRADVEDPDELGRSHFGTLDRWIAWLRNHSTKNWAAWNGIIYRMSDLKADRWPETPATLDDLKA